MNASFRICFTSIAILVSGRIDLLASDQTQLDEFYHWPSYTNPPIYDFSKEVINLRPPKKVLDDVKNVAGTYTDGWWCFRYGPTKNPLVTDASWVPMIARLNKDFSYITDVMGWPRDLRAQRGYYSTVYLFGSGLSTDDASNTSRGGWMSSVNYKGENWPIVLASYYPVHSFDLAYVDNDKKYQTGCMVHEGIHAIQASMPGCKNSAWFYEGSDCWLQGSMESQRSGKPPSLGWLSASSTIAPFQPIECYSGWLQDGSFGGPSAEGVNIFDRNNAQVCSWRTLLGGSQYSELFPYYLELVLGRKSMAWIWRYSTQSGHVLQDLAEVKGGLGPSQTRRLIQEYRGRQAMCDFGPLSKSYNDLLIKSWNLNIGPENFPYWINCPIWQATCYVATTKDGPLLTPEERTLPGWSGANQIPLCVRGTKASIFFYPRDPNMSCQLVYRTTDNKIRYSVPVNNGLCSIALCNVKNNIIIAVICNTDYIYQGDETRKKKYHYTLSIAEGVVSTADIHTPWIN